MNHAMNDQEANAVQVLLNSAVATLQAQKALAEKAIRQVSDENLRRALDGNTNSIAIVMKHMAGNMLSRWTDFLTTDGEKPWRHRDQEFVDDFDSRDAVMAYWERGWACVLDAVSSLQPSDIERPVTIRGEPHTIFEAIHRQIAHYGYHVGQIVQLARHWAEDQWEDLTIPRGGSDAFNREMNARTLTSQPDPNDASPTRRDRGGPGASAE
jgi:hypothetical protein